MRRLLFLSCFGELLSTVLGYDLSNLPSHPRLMFTAERVDEVLAMNQSDTYYRGILSSLQSTANSAIATPLDITSAALWSSTYRMQVAAVSGTYLLQKDTKYSSWVAQSLLTLASLDDWLPSNYLTTADIAMTVAIGYDWIYDTLSAEQRQEIEQSLMSKGLTPSLDLSANSWRKHTNNWAQVTGGCLVMSALAIADINTTLAEQVMDFSISQINVSLTQYAPDGGWIEGYSYGTYANIFLALALRSLETALGSTLGLAELPGMSNLGNWLTHNYGQVGGFSFGDGAWTFNANSLWSIGYWAQTYDRPEWLQGMLSHFTGTQAATFQAFLFYSSSLMTPSILSTMPRYDQFKNVAGMAHRSSWTETDGWFLGFMGGFNGRSHGHLDAGSFVIDYKGNRWAQLLGSDDYSLPLYFDGSRRWTYYRCRSEGANTLSISDQVQQPLHFANQIPSANNSLLWVGSFDNSSRFGVANLTQAYSNVTTSVFRGVALLNDSQIIIRDEISAPAPVDIASSWHTAATVNIDSSTNKSATLAMGSSSMVIKVLSPPEAFLELVDTNPCNSYSPCSEATNVGISNLVVRLGSVTTQANIIVSIAENEASISSFDLPLNEWYQECTVDCWSSSNVENPYWLTDSEVYY